MTRISFTVALLTLCLSISAKTISRKEYIRTYYKIAITEMQNYGIPASITMAQGILESGDGNSYLATKGRNHFAIKCHDWTGATVRVDDDKKNECFRKYKSPIESYEDHSVFLKRSRYLFLYDYKPDNYKSWAKGLKKAGYATDPKYPQKLIKIIEDNELYLLDDYALSKRPNADNLPAYIRDNKDITNDSNIANWTDSEQSSKPTKAVFAKPAAETLTSDNGVVYIVLKEGMTLEDVANEYGMKSWEVYKFNDVKRGQRQKPTAGQRVYLKSKKGKGTRDELYHMVVKGETMYSISQLHGIRLKSLYRLNNMDKETQPQVGKYISLYKRELEK